MTSSTTPDRTAESLPNTMRAVTQDRYGDSSVLSTSEIALPSIKADQVLVRVHAAGLDRGTEHLMTGEPWLIRVMGYGFTKPKNPVPGLDVAGEVCAVGADVTRFAVGDAVFGIADGSFAEFAAADESKLSAKPDTLSFEQAAASSVSGITALQALADTAQLQAGEAVLVIGASGGVGSFAVQIARSLGANVDGIAGTANLELVRSLGADQAYDHSVTDLEDVPKTYDVILELAGRNPVRKLRGLLKADGRLVMAGGEGGNRLTGGMGRSIRAALRSPFISQRLLMFVSTEHHSFIDRLATYLESGDVVPHIGGRFTLGQAGAAMRELEAGHAQGKIVIQVLDEASQEQP